MTTHIFTYGPKQSWNLQPGVAHSQLPSAPVDAARELGRILSDSRVDTVVFWDPSLGDVPWETLRRFQSSLDDVWHPGAGLTGLEQDQIFQHAHPLWIYRRSPDPDAIGLVNWKLTFRAAFARASVLRGVGALDSQFESLAGCSAELGLRLFTRGAVMRQHPELLALTPTIEIMSVADRYRLLRRRASPKWVAYSLVREVIERRSLAEISGWRATRDDTPTPATPPASLQRNLDDVRLDSHPTVSVVLPTFGRYKYLAEVLDDLRSQTIAPTQILIADGNPPGERDEALYERYRDLPIEVLWHEVPGICSGRNACLKRTTGDYVWFVDDDSRFESTNLEFHLRALAAYGADVSVGPAFMRQRPELTEEQREIACCFMDCGTTLCRRSMIEAVGAFDMQFNLYLAGEDNDLGIRFVNAGGLMLNNPLAKRFHYLAPVGGSRSKGSVHVFRRWTLLPRPVQSVFYLARRHFESSVVWDAMLQAGVKVGWRSKGPKTRTWAVRNLVEEIIAAPVSLLRFANSVRIGKSMIEEGPRISPLDPRQVRTARASVDT